MDMFPASDFYRFSDRGWAEWNLFHIAAHKQLFQGAQAAGKQVAYYPLDHDRADDRWKEVHQIVHSSLNQVLQINAGYSNFSDVDFNDEEQFTTWMYYHALAHKQIRLALGL